MQRGAILNLDAYLLIMGLSTEPPIASHASLDIFTNPWPLQEAWPLHAFVAVLQSLWPLHLFTPKQWTFASLLACTAVMGAAENNAAAAVAMAIVVNFLLVVILISSEPYCQ